MTYRGGCHCGKVAFEVDGDLTAAGQCNCSICTKKAYLHWIVERDRFRLLTPESISRSIGSTPRPLNITFARFAG